MVAFIIFGVFAFTRCIGRVFLIPVLAARSASSVSIASGYCSSFATALAARSASAKADKLCLYQAP